MWLIVQVQSMLKTKLSCLDRLDRVWFMMKTRQDNDMTDRAGVVYVKNKTKLSWLIKPSVVYDESQIGQRHDQSYRYNLRQKRYLTIITNRTWFWLWLIIQIWSTLKKKLSCRNQSNWVWSVIKIKQDNDVINHIGLVYVKNDIELLGPIGPGAVNDETK